MKWKSRDIIIVERANIPKFNKINDIMNPLILLELFFDDVLNDMIVGYTKLYSHGQNAEIGFEITNEKMCLFFSMLLLSRCHKLSDRKMYWETIPNNFV